MSAADNRSEQPRRVQSEVAELRVAAGEALVSANSYQTVYNGKIRNEHKVVASVKAEAQAQARKALALIDRARAHAPDKLSGPDAAQFAVYAAFAKALLEQDYRDELGLAQTHLPSVSDPTRRSDLQKNIQRLTDAQSKHEIIWFRLH